MFIQNSSSFVCLFNNVLSNTQFNLLRITCELQRRRRTRGLGEDNRPSDLYLNPGHSKYKGGVITIPRKTKVVIYSAQTRDVMIRK
jgi:hypothetical protein